MGTVRFLNPLLGKALAISGVTLVLLVPLGRLEDLVGERAGMRELASQRVANGWGGPQTVSAPILSVTVETEYEERGRKFRTVTLRRMLAASADIRGDIKPQLRHVGIYTVPVFEVPLQISGAFLPDAVTPLLTPDPKRTVRWSAATLFIPIGEVRGIRAMTTVRWGDRQLQLRPANYDGITGVAADVDATGLRNGETLEFQLEFTLAGSGTLRALPLAGSTSVHLKSVWQHPSFDGAFLPSYSLDERGFKARWQVLELNRGFPQSWDDNAVQRAVIESAAFGVNLFQPVDTYHRNERAIKYALLFISLTFMSVFLWEQVSGARIHAMQYLFVGFALCVFYLLLLALSEHLLFGLAYLIATIAQAGLVGVYMGSGLKDGWIGLIVGSSLSAVFGLLYLLILSEQYSLLLGAVFVFAVLAALMLATRRTDWYALSSRTKQAVAGEG
jgi:inner membrane protein